jgi:GT2 family glycosyltransferase
MIKVFLVILNWNSAKDTIECLKSVGRFSIVGYELSVVVIDNASSDNSVKEIQNSDIKSQNDKLKFKIIRNEKNLGFAGGNNIGLNYAIENKADYILILNNDTTVDPQLLVNLLKVAKENKEAGILSPKIYFAAGYEFHKKRYGISDRGRVIWAAGGSFDWKNVFGVNRGVDEIDHGQYDTAKKMDFATGACMFIKCGVLKKVGMFDPRFFAYFEDADLCMKVKRAGYEIYYVPKAIVWHKVAQSSGIGSDLNDYYITRNRLIFGLKYAPIRSKLALIRESIQLLLIGRKWQKIGVVDYYLGNYGKGSWK